MRKPTTYFVMGISTVPVAIVAVMLMAFGTSDVRIEDVLAVYQDGTEYSGLTIHYPLNDTLFPPEIVPPTFRWEDSKSESDTWLITIKFQDDEGRMNSLTHDSEWTPKAEEWETIKKRSLEKEAEVSVLGVNASAPEKILSGGRISISTSRDEVGAPLFYRDVNLPFVDAVKDPSLIRWRFGAISSPEQPPVVLDNLPVCGNCHSFSADGKTLAMDVDYANSKGSYVITRIVEEMVLATSDIITWDEYKKEDMEQTFGLLSQISPDGKVVVSTVKDKSVFVPKPGLEFSQLFFPIKGILCTYDTRTRAFNSLPGADDPHYVQSDPTWSSDGKYIVFARAEAYSLKYTKGEGKVLLTPEECEEFLKGGKPFLFDLYRVPYNDGKGGKAEPLEGASNNGVSNYFAKYSPDGKWIVFCKAKSYSLLQPDSELYIMPAEGGEPRRLRCNTERMNSWHSWSPNGKWLVFTSKVNGPYTQLFLTHIDEEGRSTPPVLLEHFTAPDRAANIPEFVNNKPTAIKRIHEQFLNDYSFVRAGNEFFKAGEADNAIEEYKNALELNPNNVEAHLKMGFLLYNIKEMYEEGMGHLLKAMQLEPRDPRIHYDLGMALLHQRKYDQAVRHLSVALQHMPSYIPDKRYNVPDMHYNLGMALFYVRKFEESTTHLSEAARLDPENAKVHYSLAMVLAVQGKIDETVKHYTEAVRIQPDIDTSPTLHDFMAANYAKAGRFREAVLSAEKALDLARATGKEDLAREIQKRIELYKQNKPYEP
jgi:tetratricopeptide (TPR) repeat protein